MDGIAERRESAVGDTLFVDKYIDGGGKRLTADLGVVASQTGKPGDGAPAAAAAAACFMSRGQASNDTAGHLQKIWLSTIKHLRTKVGTREIKCPKLNRSWPTFRSSKPSAVSGQTARNAAVRPKPKKPPWRTAGCEKRPKPTLHDLAEAQKYDKAHHALREAK